MSEHETFRFRLNVAGHAQNSADAVANLGGLYREHLAGRHEIEVVDVFSEPGRALDEGIFMSPTLLKLAPSPAPGGLSVRSSRSCP